MTPSTARSLVQPEVEWLALGGGLVEVAVSRDGHLRVSFAPGGFTVASR